MCLRIGAWIGAWKGEDKVLNSKHEARAAKARARKKRLVRKQASHYRETAKALQTVIDAVWALGYGKFVTADLEQACWKGEELLKAFKEVQSAK